MNSGPMRMCAGCRERRAQRTMIRFAQRAGLWKHQAGAAKEDGRGAYVCCAECARRLVKNKRYAGLAATAIAALSDRKGVN